ncbi:MAG: hypothetical protein LBE67_12430 [Kocuria palustris]|jgi:hypothetical protein|uniref:hypothetical protein n=1 Tax=Kocuria palustris TaxID=71999 RepID=UPI001D1D9310|nr:hypothetical protein [Kocuria palustris]MBZ6375771.1 hypothetical protein [Kocuria palustris]
MPFRGAYLGPAGSMQLLGHIRGKASVSSSRATSYRATLGGRLRAQVSPQVLREWKCELPLATPEEARHLKALASGVFGLGPFSWVPVQATTTNVMSLGASMPGPSHASWQGPGVASGAWSLPGMGLVRHSVVADGQRITMGIGTPVVAGMPLTGAAWISGSGVVWTQTVDRSGAIVDMASTRVMGTDPVRVSATIPAVSPAAVSARVRVTEATQLALPSLAWTDQLEDWAPGGGSNQVLVEGFDADLLHLDPSQGLHEDISFTVKELSSDA